MFPEIRRRKKILSLPARIVECVSEYIFLISKNKQAKKAQKSKNTKKAKETKEERRIFPENRLKKQIHGRLDEDFSGHPHFRKQDYFFFGLILIMQLYQKFHEQLIKI